MKPCKCVQANILFTVYQTEGLNDGIGHIILRTALCDMVESSIDGAGHQVRKLYEHTIVGAHRNDRLNAGPSLEDIGIAPFHSLFKVAKRNLIQ